MIASHSLLRISARRGGVILCFHRISATAFCGLVRRLLRVFTLVSLDEIVTRREHGRPLRGLLAITFDDGWADTCEPIAPVCEASGWPITIYLMTSLLAGQQRFWFAELYDLLGTAAGRRFAVDGKVVDLRLRAAAATKARLVQQLRMLPSADAVAMIDRIAMASGTSWRHPEPEFIDAEFVTAYRRSNCVSFGSHTIDHQALSAQSEPDIARQLSESRASLEAAVGRPVSHFCYPYGDRHAIGRLAPKLARVHYRSATTMIRGVCTGTSELSYLPRVPVYGTDSAARVLAKLSLAWCI